jgi:hypothetical protein
MYREKETCVGEKVAWAPHRYSHMITVMYMSFATARCFEPPPVSDPREESQKDAVRW